MDVVEEEKSRLRAAQQRFGLFDQPASPSWHIIAASLASGIIANGPTKPTAAQACDIFSEVLAELLSRCEDTVSR